MHEKAWLALAAALAWPLPGVPEAAARTLDDASVDADARHERGGPKDPDLGVCLSIAPDPPELEGPSDAPDEGDGETSPDAPNDAPNPEDPDDAGDASEIDDDLLSAGPCLTTVVEPETHPCLSIIEPRSRCAVQDPDDADAPLALGGALLLTVAARRRRRRALLRELEEAGSLPRDVVARLRERE